MYSKKSVLIYKYYRVKGVRVYGCSSRRLFHEPSFLCVLFISEGIKDGVSLELAVPVLRRFKTSAANIHGTPSFVN